MNNNKKRTVLNLTKVAMVTALYVVITMIFSVISFGAIQVRIAEMLNLLVLYDKKYIYAVTAGVFISNLSSTLGVVDVVVGTLATLLSLITINYLNKKIDTFKMKLVMSVIVCSFFVLPIAIEIVVLFPGTPLLFTCITVVLGEALSMSIGAAILNKIDKHLNLKEIL